jgi:hypothetical protein
MAVAGGMMTELEDLYTAMSNLAIHLPHAQYHARPDL